MKSYTTTEALVDKIENMKSRRKEQQSWSEEDEQILAFLVELHIQRTTFFHIFEKMKKIAGIISDVHDEMQDEKGLLVR